MREGEDSKLNEKAKEIADGVYAGSTFHLKAKIENIESRLESTNEYLADVLSELRKLNTHLKQKG